MSPPPGEENDEAVRLWDRYDESGDLDLLEQAIDLLRRGLGQTGVTPEIRLNLTANLSGALAARSLRTARLDDLREAATLAHEVQAVTAANDPRFTGRLTNVGLTLTAYFKRTGDTSVLAAAISAFEAVLSLEPTPAAESNLVVCLRDSYAADRDPAVLERAVSLARSSATGNRSDPLFARYQANLSSTLCDKYRVDGDPELLIEARRAIRAALAETPAGHPNLAERSSTHAQVLQQIYLAGRQPQDLTAFRTAARRAEQVVPAGHPNRGGVLDFRAMADYYQAYVTGNQAAAATAQRWFHRLVENPDLPLTDRVSAARTSALICLAAGDLAGALVTFGRAVELLPLTAGRHLEALDRQRRVALFSTLVSDAAACALSAADPPLALGLLEQGRGVLPGAGHRGLAGPRPAGTGPTRPCRRLPSPPWPVRRPTKLTTPKTWLRPEPTVSRPPNAADGPPRNGTDCSPPSGRSPDSANSCGRRHPSSCCRPGGTAQW